MICGMSLAEHIAQESKDPRTKVGASILDDKGRVMGVGYNGFPRGFEDTPERLKNREMKNTYVVHAEANAILNSRGGCEDGSMYCTKFPCCNCAGLIIQSGIKKVIAFEPDVDWLGNQESALNMFLESGIEVEIWKCA